MRKHCPLTASLAVIAGLLASTMVASAAVKFECGKYKIAGTLRMRGAGVHVLEVYPGSRTHFDLVVHGIPTADSVAYKDRPVQFDAIVYHPGVDGSARARFVGPISSATQEQLTRQPVHLLQREACPSSQ